MAAAPTSTGTVVPADQGGAFPPFRTDTFPSQIFWLAITFTVLLVVMWRIVGPRIGGVIGERKGKVAGDLATADTHRKDAEGDARLLPGDPGGGPSPRPETGRAKP